MVADEGGKMYGRARGGTALRRAERGRRDAMRFARPLVALVALAVVLGVGAGPASAVLVRLPNGKVLGYAPLIGQPLGSGAPLVPGTLTRPSTKFDQAFSNLDYSGGPVMPSNKNYTIVWSPSNYTGTKFQTEYPQGVANFFKDLQAVKGASTNSDAVSTQYNDASGNTAAYNSEFKGAITDTDPLPTSGCIYAPSGGA